MTKPVGTDISTAPPGTWAERFRLVRRVGSGGFADVFEAVSIDSDGTQPVALKVLRETIDPVAWDRFRKEVVALQTLDSPSIVSALEVDRTMQWYTMPLASDDLWTRAPELDSIEKYEVVESIARGLCAAHSKLLVHRDVSPGNILCFPDDEKRWKLSDFGLVRRFPGHTTQVVTSGAGLGTVYFSPPEAEIDPHRMDQRADIFGLGQVIGWLISGQRPRPQQTTVLGHGPWTDIVRRMTARTIDQRPQSMDAVLAELPEVLVNIRSQIRRTWETGGLARPPSHADAATLGVLRHVYTEGTATERSLLDECRALGLTKLGVRMAIDRARLDGLLREQQTENDHGEQWFVLVVTPEGLSAVSASLSENDIFARPSQLEAFGAGADEIPF